MIKDRLTILQKMVDKYTIWYDVTSGDLGSGLPLEAYCEHRSRKEKYVLSRKAKLWAAEVNELLYLFSMQSLDRFQAEACISFSIENALPRVKPHSEHMYSFITVIFVADNIEPEALKFIRRRSFTKTFRFGFYGSSPLKTAALSIENEMIVANNMGRDLRKQIKNIYKE